MEWRDWKENDIFRDLRGNIKMSNIYATRVPGEMKESGAEKAFEEQWLENSDIWQKTKTSMSFEF